MTRMLTDPGQTSRDTPARLDQLLAQSARAHAQRTAVVDGSSRLSYAELAPSTVGQGEMSGGR